MEPASNPEIDHLISSRAITPRITPAPRRILIKAVNWLGDVVMSLDTGAIKYWTGHPGVVAPNDPIATIQSVAQAYNVRWLYVERADAVEALGPILDGNGRPGWAG